MMSLWERTDRSASNPYKKLSIHYFGVISYNISTVCTDITSTSLLFLEGLGLRELVLYCGSLSLILLFRKIKYL
jgi:hypothetical protein